MSISEPTKEDYDSLIFEPATLENELSQLKKLLEAPTKVSLWRGGRRLGAKVVVAVAIILANLITFGCSTFVPVTDVSKIPKDTLQQAYKVRTFMVGSNVNHPPIKEYLGDIKAYSCKHLMWDPPASKGDALTQLRLKALEMGADGIIDVTFDSRGTDAFGTNCWESVQASGVAVKFE